MRCKVERWTVLATVVAAIMLLVTQACVAGNLLSNPGFENPIELRAGSGGAIMTANGWTIKFPGSYSYAVKETHYVGDTPCGDSHPYEGSDALSFSTEGAGEVWASQRIRVNPKTQYTASVYVKAYDYSGNKTGFGAASTDLAGLWIRELGFAGNVTVDHTELKVTAPTEFVQLTTTFTTGSDTYYIDYILRGVISCHWSRGRIALDNAVLDGPAGTAQYADITGTVIANGLPASGATVTAPATGVSDVADSEGNYTLPSAGEVGSHAQVAVSFDGCSQRNEYLDVAPGSNVCNIEMFPVSTMNLLTNPGFEQGVPHAGPIENGQGYGTECGWSYAFMGGVGYFRCESLSTTAWLPREIFSGNEAMRQMSDGNGHIVAYQDIYINPGSNYTASAWVRTVSLNANGFGSSATDSAGLWIQELDAFDEVVVNHAKKELKAASDWTLLQDSFTADGGTVKIRYMLDTVIACGYPNGWASYDLCALEGIAPPAVLTGTVTSNSAPVSDATAQLLQNVGGVETEIDSRITGSDGSYTFPNATPGGYTVRASKTGYFAQRKTQNIAYGPNTASFDLVAVNENLLKEAGFDDAWPTSVWSFVHGGNETYFKQFGVGDYYTTSGGEALAIFGSVTGPVTGSAVQSVPVVPGSHYVARVKFRPSASAATTWGDPSDTQRAWLSVEEYDDNGNLAITPAIVYATEMGGWETLEIPFDATGQTVQVKVIGGATVNDNWYGNLARAVFDDFELNGAAGSMASLHGTVTSNGTPIAGAIVATGTLTTTTDANGKWELNPPSGNYELRASQPGYYAQRVTVIAPSSATNFNLVAVNMLTNAGFDDGAIAGWNSEVEGTGVLNAETLATPYGPVFFDSGYEALGFIGNGDGAGRVYQDVPVQAGGNYTASVRFKAADNAPGVAIWGSLEDNQQGGLYVQEYGVTGNLLVDHPMVLAAETKEWETLTLAFQAGQQTAFVRVGGYGRVLDPYGSTLARALFDSFSLVGPAAPGTSIGSLRDLEDGCKVKLTGKVVTANFNGFFYVEEEDRSSGIKVIGSVAPGYIVDIVGKISTVDGERTIIEPTIYATYGETIPTPLGMNNKAAAQGLDAVGLYVTMWGKVDATGGSPFTMTDGAGANFKVYGSATANDYVRVTGALGAEGSPAVPVLRAVSVTKID